MNTDIKLICAIYCNALCIRLKKWLLKVDTRSDIHYKILDNSLIFKCES